MCFADFHVFVEGGIRRGSDVFKAIALGARAVGIGRPVACAMSAYGADGISAMVAALRDELEVRYQLSYTHHRVFCIGAGD